MPSQFGRHLHKGLDHSSRPRVGGDALPAGGGPRQHQREQPADLPLERHGRPRGREAAVQRIQRRGRTCRFLLGVPLPPSGFSGIESSDTIRSGSMADHDSVSLSAMTTIRRFPTATNSGCTTSTGTSVRQSDKKRLERLAMQHLSNTGNIHDRPIETIWTKPLWPRFATREFSSAAGIGLEPMTSSACGDSPPCEKPCESQHLLSILHSFPPQKIAIVSNQLERLTSTGEPASRRRASK